MAAGLRALVVGGALVGVLLADLPAGSCITSCDNGLPPGVSGGAVRRSRAPGRHGADRTRSRARFGSPPRRAARSGTEPVVPGESAQRRIVIRDGRVISDGRVVSGGRVVPAGGGVRRGPVGGGQALPAVEPELQAPPQATAAPAEAWAPETVGGPQPARRRRVAMGVRPARGGSPWAAGGVGMLLGAVAVLAGVYLWRRRPAPMAAETTGPIPAVPPPPSHVEVLDFGPGPGRPEDPADG